MVVKEPAGKYSSDLLKVCEDHFSRIYPDYVNTMDHETVMCPPAFPFEYIAPTGEASGAIPLADIEKVNIEGDSAELQLFYVLEKFGKATNQPMFVLPKVKYAEFIENIIRQTVPLNRQTDLEKIKFDEESDFVIVHRNIGVILIEVKSTKKFSKSHQGKARKQLQAGEKIIRALLHADHSQEISIPVKKVIAMPNVSDPGRGNQEYISLREIDTRHSEGGFASWWQNNFDSREFDNNEKQQLQRLIAILVRLKCKVSSEILSDVYEKIDEQEFLRNSHKKYTKQDGDGPEVVVKSADRPERNILSTKFTFLNLEQLRIWNGPRKQFFNGASGCGKTILLQFKALECVKRKEEKVMIVVPSSLTNLYKEFFDDNIEDNISSRVTICSPLELSKLLQRRDFDGDQVSNVKSDPGCDFASNNGGYSTSDAQNGSGSDLREFHFFVDEMQIFEAEIPDTMNLLEKLLTRITDQDCYCWVAYDYMQRNESVVSRDETGGLSGATEIQTQARELCKTFGVYHSSCMKTILRSTFEIYNFVQAFVKNSLLKLVQRLNQPEFDHIEQEAKELWVSFTKRYDVSNYLGHHVCGPPVSSFKNLDFDSIANVIEDEVKKWSKSGLHHVAVLFTSFFPKENLSRLMAQKRIPVCDVSNREENKVVLDFGHNAHSHEWRVVVAISWFNDKLISNYIMFTRTVSRLVVITIDEEEMFPHNRLCKLPD